MFSALRHAAPEVHGQQPRREPARPAPCRETERAKLTAMATRSHHPKNTRASAGADWGLKGREQRRTGRQRSAQNKPCTRHLL